MFSAILFHRNAYCCTGRSPVMAGGGRCRINAQKFQNDLTNIKSRDDIMTLLVHLGYLAYDGGEVFIPNQEVAGEFENALEGGGW